MKTKVIVNDRMQRGYVCWRTEPAGRNVAPGVTPELTPKEVLRLGVFIGSTLRKIFEYRGDVNRLRCGVA